MNDKVWQMKLNRENDLVPVEVPGFATIEDCIKGIEEMKEHIIEFRKKLEE